MPKEIFEISNFGGIDLSSSSEDANTTSAIDIVNIDNERSMGTLTPVKRDKFLTRTGFSDNETNIGIDDDVFILGIETLRHKDETDLVLISAGDMGEDEGQGASIDAFLDIYSTDETLDVHLAGEDDAIPNVVTVVDSAGGEVEIDNTTYSSEEPIIGVTNFSTDNIIAMSKWNESLHIGTGNRSQDRAKWVGRMKHGFTDVYRDENGDRHEFYDQLGCLEAAVTPPQSTNFSKIVSDCNTDPSSSSPSSTADEKNQRVGRYAYAINYEGNYVYKYDTKSDGGDHVNSWDLVKRSAFYPGITAICYDPNETLATTQWPGLHSAGDGGVIIIAVRGSGAAGLWGGQIVVLGPDLIEYQRYNISYPADRPWDDGMTEEWLGVNQPETGDFSRFNCYKNSRGHGIGDIAISSPMNTDFRTLWISIWGPHKISVSDNLLGVGHYEDNSDSGMSNLWLEGSFRVLWSHTMDSWNNNEYMSFKNSSPPCHGNRKKGDEISNWDATSDEYFFNRPAVWREPGYYFIPKNALFHSADKKWIGLIARCASRGADNFVRNRDDAMDDGTVYAESKAVRKEHWSEFEPPISIVDSPKIFDAEGSMTGWDTDDTSRSDIQPLRLNGSENPSQDDDKYVRYCLDVMIMVHYQRDLRTGSLNAGGGAHNGVPYGIHYTSGAGAYTWKSWHGPSNQGEAVFESVNDGAKYNQNTFSHLKSFNQFRFWGQEHDASYLSDTVGIVRLMRRGYDSNPQSPIIDDFSAQFVYNADHDGLPNQSNVDNHLDAAARICMMSAMSGEAGADFPEPNNDLEAAKYPVTSIFGIRPVSDDSAPHGIHVSNYPFRRIYLATQNNNTNKANYLTFDNGIFTATDHATYYIGYAANSPPNLDSNYHPTCTDRSGPNKPLLCPIVLYNTNVGAGQFTELYQWIVASSGKSDVYSAFVAENNYDPDDGVSADLEYTFTETADGEGDSYIGFSHYDAAGGNHYYDMLHLSHPLLTTGADILNFEISSNNDNRWKGNKGRFGYKISTIMDGYQDSALGLSGEHVPLVGDEEDGNLNSAQIEISVQCFDDTYVLYNTRVSGYAIYRAELADDGTQISEYQQVKYINFSEDPGVKSDVVDNSWNTPRTNYYRKWSFADYGEPGVGFAALTGLPETLKNTSLGYKLSTHIGSYHFVGGAYVNETGEQVDNGIFRSQPSKFDVFDWSNDYILLPDTPNAIQGFLGRLYAFTSREVYVIDPNTLQILDTFSGGAFGPRSVAISDEYGMCYANRSGIFLHNGNRSSNISDVILESYDTDYEGTNSYMAAWGNNALLNWGNTSFERFRLPHIQWFPEKDCFIVFMGYRSSSDGPNVGFVYTPKLNKWTKITSNYIQASCLGDRDDLLYVSGKGEGTATVAVRQLQRGNTYSADDPTWISQKLTMNMPTTEKIFSKFKLSGNFPSGIAPGFILTTDKGNLSNTTDIEEVASESTSVLKVYKIKGEKRKGRWIRVQLGSNQGWLTSKGHIESLSISYKPKKRV